MVKNRKELIEIANENSAQFQSHIKHAIETFMEENGIDEDELAYSLGIDEEEMYEIVDGDANITVDTLSKLLVATDMAVEIKPISMTPLREYSHDMPKCGGFDADDECGLFGPFNDEQDGLNFDVEPEHKDVKPSLPPRDSKGRFMKRQSVEEEPEHNPYLDLDEDALADIIFYNNWDDEIDLDFADKDEMVDFIMHKEELRRQEEEKKHAHCRRHHCEKKKSDVKGGGAAFNKFIDMLHNLEKEAQDNPDLADAIERLMGE